jgi:hypothetical protein
VEVSLSKEWNEKGSCSNGIPGRGNRAGSTVALWKIPMSLQVRPQVYCDNSSQVTRQTQLKERRGHNDNVALSDNICRSQRIFLANATLEDLQKKHFWMFK